MPIPCSNHERAVLSRESSHEIWAPCVLALNGGSSSIRFAVYEAGYTPRDAVADLAGAVSLAVVPDVSAQFIGRMSEMQRLGEKVQQTDVQGMNDKLVLTLQSMRHAMEETCGLISTDSGNTEVAKWS